MGVELAADRSIACTSPAAFTGRAVLAGMAVGVPLTLVNLYMGLRTGLWESGNVVASVGSVAVLRGLFPGRHSGAADTHFAQTAATSMAAMPATAGLVASVPAMVSLGRVPSLWFLAVWGILLGIAGMLIAAALRGPFQRDRLPFPTSIATAETISAMHTSDDARSRPRARLFGAAACVTAALTVLRERGFLAATFGSGPFQIAASPMLVAVGILIGSRAGLDILAGSVAAVLLREWLLVPSPNDSVDIVVWPATALLVGFASVSCRQALSVTRAIRDLAMRSATPRTLLVGVVVFGSVTALPVAVLGAPLLIIAIATMAGSILAAASARAAGETDVNPIGPLSQVAQVGSGGASADAMTSVVGGAIPAGMAPQTMSTLISVEAARRLGLSRAAVPIAQLLGITAGACVSVSLFAALLQRGSLGSESLPVPAAKQWEAIARVCAGGWSAVPAPVAGLTVFALVVGGALALLGSTTRLPDRARRLLPVVPAFGIGLLLPASYSAAMALGSLIGLVTRRRTSGGSSITVAAAGALAAESTIAMVLMALS